MLQSSIALETLPDVSLVAHLSRSVFSLLLSLGFCWTLYQLCKPHHRALGKVLCIVSALVLLLHYAS